MNPKFWKSIRVRIYMKSTSVVSVRVIFGFMPSYEEFDQRFEDMLVKQINESRLDHVIILALDGVYDERGCFDEKRIVKAISNDAAARLQAIQEIASWCVSQSFVARCARRTREGNGTQTCADKVAHGIRSS